MDRSKVTIAVCNFNTTKLTNDCIRSVVKNVKGIDYKIVVLDNSNKEPFELDSNVKADIQVIDNTQGKYSDFDKLLPFLKARPSFNNYASARHCYAVQFLLDICQTKHMILLDSDVIVNKSFDFIDGNCVFSASIEHRPLDFRNMPYVPRALPYIMSFNIEAMRHNKLKYFDPCRLVETAVDKIYDTGASFLEDVKAKHLRYREIDYRKYIVHLGGRSWSTTVDMQCIVAFTTFGSRLSRIERTLQQIAKQKTFVKTHACITLDKRDIARLTAQQRQAIAKHGAQVIIGDNSLRPHNKYFFVMQQHRELPIITIDDDIQYDEHLVQSLYDSYMRHPDCVSAARVHLMRFSGNKVLPYGKWKFEYEKELQPSHDLFATGVGGVLYPPNILKLSSEDLPMIQKSIAADDVFLKKKELMLGVKVVKACCSSHLNAYPESFDKTSLSYNGQSFDTNTQIIDALCLDRCCI